MSTGTQVPIRREVRLRLRTIVVVWSPAWRDMLALETANVSRGGMFLRMLEPPPVDTPVVIRLRRIDGSTDIAGVVAHVTIDAIGDTPAGFGVRFEPLDQNDRGAIEELIEHASHSEPNFDSSVDPAIVQAELARLRQLAAQRNGQAITPVSRGAVLLDASQAKLQGAYHFARGEELLARGRLEEACQSFRRALEIDPEHVDAIAALRSCWEARRLRPGLPTR